MLKSVTSVLYCKHTFISQGDSQVSGDGTPGPHGAPGRPGEIVTIQIVLLETQFLSRDIRGNPFISHILYFREIQVSVESKGHQGTMDHRALWWDKFMLLSWLEQITCGTLEKLLCDKCPHSLWTGDSWSLGCSGSEGKVYEYIFGFVYIVDIFLGLKRRKPNLSCSFFFFWPDCLVISHCPSFWLVPLLAMWKGNVLEGRLNICICYSVVVSCDTPIRQVVIRYCLLNHDCRYLSVYPWEKQGLFSGKLKCETK